MAYTMKAKRSNQCPFCGAGIQKGVDTITKRGGVWGHETCPVSAPAALRVERSTPPADVPLVDFNLIALGDAAADVAHQQPVAEVPAVVVVREFRPSKFQQDFYDAMSQPGNIALKATAGSGKSTTLKNAFPYLDPKSAVVAVVFAKRNADDLKATMPAWIEAKTTHSLAYSNVRAAWKGCEVNDKKLWDIMREIGRESTDNRKAIEAAGPQIAKIVGLRKNTLRDDVDMLIDHYGVELPADHFEQSIALSKRVFERSIDDTTTADFDDMLYWCAVGRVPCKQFDTILDDEVQDENQAQIDFILRSLKPGGRVLSVGDPMQSIFGFRGAALDAFEQVVRQTNAREMPLSITYRLPLSHVELVQGLFPEANMLPRDNAPKGEIGHMEEKDLTKRVRQGDMVVCRLNAPLVRPCFELIRAGVKAVIVGRDVGRNLAQVLEKAAKRALSQSLAMVLSALEEYTRGEVAKLNRVGKEQSAQNLLDTFETLIALSDGCSTVGEVTAKIASVFSDDVQGVVFSSVHRAKGLEADNVYILHPSLMPARFAKQEWEKKQENNIKFVAYTRSKHGLYFVG